MVQPGEYLTLIAEQYGVTAQEIADANGIAMDSILSVGQELIIPGTEPAPTSTEAATATPEPSPTEPSEPEGGVISVLVFEDRDGDGLRGDGEPLLSGARIALYTADGALVAEDVVDAAAGPFVQNLPAGAYVIRVENPAGYESVASDEWAATLVDGGQIEVVFGARFTPTATPEPAPTQAPAPRHAEAEEPTAPASSGRSPQLGHPGGHSWRSCCRWGAPVEGPELLGRSAHGGARPVANRRPAPGEDPYLALALLLALLAACRPHRPGIVNTRAGSDRLFLLQRVYDSPKTCAPGRCPPLAAHRRPRPGLPHFVFYAALPY